MASNHQNEEVRKKRDEEKEYCGLRCGNNYKLRQKEATCNSFLYGGPKLDELTALSQEIERSE